MISRERETDIYLNFPTRLPNEISRIQGNLIYADKVRLLDDADLKWWDKYDQIMYIDSDVFALPNAPNIFEEYPDTEKIRSVLTESGQKVFWLEATQMALELGEPILLNMIMLGALSALPDFPLDAGDFRSALKDIFPESKLEVNFRALDMGASLIK